MNLSSLFGIKSRLRRLRIIAGEGAIALEDRAQLLRFAWEDEKQRLRLTLGLMIAVIGLTTVAIALLSVAIVVQFWDTPQRSLVAWLLAAFWVGLWLVAVLLLAKKLNQASASFEPARAAFERDLQWLHAQFGSEGPDGVQREPRAPSRAELMARIERQRLRVATLQAAASSAGEAPVEPEPPSAAAVRMAREHPVATGVAAATVLAVLGPRRLVRWAAVVAPVLWRMR